MTIDPQSKACPSHRIGKHVAFHRDLVRYLLERFEPHEVRLTLGWTDSREEALAALATDPREWFTECDNIDKTGRCRGHEASGDESS